VEWILSRACWEEDRKSAYALLEPGGREMLPVHLCALARADKGAVSRALEELEVEGRIRNTGKRIYVIAEPVIVPIDAEESVAAASRRLWATHDPKGYSDWLPKWQVNEATRAELRREERLGIKNAKAAAEIGPTAGPSEIDDGTAVVPKNSPLYIEKSRVSTIKQSSPSSSSVFTALSQYGKPDDDAVKTLLEKCRANAPDVTEDEVARIVHMKGLSSQKPSVRNPIGFLLEVVPKMFPKILIELREVDKAPPDLGPTLEELIETAIRFAEGEEWRGSVHQTDAILELEQYKRDDPDAVARVRAAMAKTKGGATS